MISSPSSLPKIALHQPCEETALSGRVVAVSRCIEHGFAKQPQASLTLVAGEGVEGDAHRGRTVQHLYQVRRDASQPNLCQVHLFASEMLAELAGHGYPLGPGEMGENLLTAGLSLLELPRGTLLRLGPAAVLEVTGLRTPCSQIDGYRAGLQKHLWGPRREPHGDLREGPRGGQGKRTRRAGIMSIVRVGGEICAGDAIQVELPPPPHLPLGPV